MGVVMSERVDATYRRVHLPLWRALVSFSRDPELASDAESEAFAQALARGDAIDDVDRWVWKAAFRIATGMLAQRSPRLDVSDIDDGRIPFSAAEFLAELGDLSEQQRACVVLRYVGQFKSGEIAEILDTTTATVSVQLGRAHTALRSRLEPAGGSQ